MPRNNKGKKEGVGYGRPPKQHRFKPGQSGNPKGRPRKKKEEEETYADDLIESLVRVGQKPILVTTGGRTERVSLLEAISESLMRSAAQKPTIALKLYGLLLRELPRDDPSAMTDPADLSPDEEAIISWMAQRFADVRGGIKDSSDEVNESKLQDESESDDE